MARRSQRLNTSLHQTGTNIDLFFANPKSQERLQIVDTVLTGRGIVTKSFIMKVKVKVESILFLILSFVGRNSDKL